LQNIFISNTPPRLEQQTGDNQADSVERMFERPWIDYKADWTGRYIRPAQILQLFRRII